MTQGQIILLMFQGSVIITGLLILGIRHYDELIKQEKLKKLSPGTLVYFRKKRYRFLNYTDNHRRYMTVRSHGGGNIEVVHIIDISLTDE